MTYGLRHEWDGDLTDTWDLANWKLRWMVELLTFERHRLRDFGVIVEAHCD